MLTPYLVSLNDHDAATPPLFVPPLTAPAAVPAAVARLERAPRQRALGQQWRQRRRRRIAREARRQRVGDRLHREVTAGFAFGCRCCLTAARLTLLCGGVSVLLPAFFLARRAVAAGTAGRVRAA